MSREANQKRMDADTLSIAPSQAETLVNDDAKHIYSATGKIQGPYKPSAFANYPGAGVVPNAPQHVPFSFTDDTIIHVTVSLNPTDNGGGESSKKPKSSFMSNMKSRIQTGASLSRSPIKVIKMPRREYLKYFAKDKVGNYVGTEPREEWTEEKLEERFGQYQSLPPTKWVVNVASGLESTE